MKKIRHSKNSIFLLEILIDIMLFTLLVIVGLTFSIKAHNITKDTRLLHNAVNCCQNVSTVYSKSMGSLADIMQFFPDSEKTDDWLDIYYDSDFNNCSKSQADYYISVVPDTDNQQKCLITFYDMTGSQVRDIYSLTACYLHPNTPNTLEVAD